MTSQSDKSVFQSKAHSDNLPSEEVQAIVDRMPTKGTTYVAAIVAMIVVIAFVLSCIISHPDTVDGTISLTSSAAPVRLVANTSGQLQFFFSDGDTVCRQAIIAGICNSADVAKVLEMETILGSPFSSDEYIKLDLLKESMGEISNVCNQYLLVLSLYRQHLSSELYATQIQNLESQIVCDEDILRHIEAGRKIRRTVLDLKSKELSKDSLLLAHKAITEKEVDEQQASYLTASESYWNTETNRATVSSRINQNRIEIRRIRQEQSETERKLLADAIGKRSDLFNQIRTWKEHYLITAPIPGKLEYLSFWRNYGFVQSGEEVVTIIPKQQELFGEVRIPSTGAGKIAVGQSVNVKVSNYPYDEYGLIKGEVSKISQIPSLFSTKEGNIDCYLVLIRFPDGSLTNYGIRLNINFESKGTAEIITKDKRLIERLFDNLKSLGTK